MSVSKAERHPLESLGRGALTTFIGQIILIGATFGSRVFLVRYLSPAQYGEIALGLATVAIITPIAGLGIQYGVTRQMAHTKDPREKYAIALSSIQLTLPLSLLGGLALYLAAPALGSYINEPGMGLVLQYLSVYLALGMLTSLIGAIFQGEENMVPTTLFNMVLSPLLLLAFLALSFRTGGTLSGAMLAYDLSAAAGFLGMGLYTYWYRTELRGKDAGQVEPLPSDRRVTRDLFLFSISLTMLGVASVVTGNVDTLLLGFVVHSAATVGTYSAMLTMARLLILGVVALSYIVLPVASRLHRGGDLSELGHSYATMIKWILALFVPVYALFMIFPSQALLLVYGPVTQTVAYASAPTVLRILATGTILACVLGPAQSVLTGIGKLRLLFYDTVASAAVDVVGAAILVPFWGIYGAAVAFSLSTITLPLLAVIQTSVAADVHPFKAEVLKPLAAFGAVSLLLFGVPAFVLHWSPGGLLLVGLAFVMMGLYLALLLLTRSLVPEDRHLLGILEAFLGRPLPPLRALIEKFAKEPKVPAKDL